MKIVDVKILAIPEIKVLRFGKFSDQRGYFAETLRESDIQKNPLLQFLRDFNFVQFNESFAYRRVMKGLHFQWQPPLGKLVRIVRGAMFDMVLDIRKHSPTFGKIILYEMSDSKAADYGEWIWVPPGFAHGMLFTEESVMEYFFTADYNPAAEASISPLSADLDWSLCDPALKSKFDALTSGQVILSDRDSRGLSLQDWIKDERFNHFTYDQAK